MFLQVLCTHLRRSATATHTCQTYRFSWYYTGKLPLLPAYRDFLRYIFFLTNRWEFLLWRQHNARPKDQCIARAFLQRTYRVHGVAHYNKNEFCHCCSNCCSFLFEYDGAYYWYFWLHVNFSVNITSVLSLCLSTNHVQTQVVNYCSKWHHFGNKGNEHLLREIIIVYKGLQFLGLAGM